MPHESVGQARRPSFGARPPDRVAEQIEIGRRDGAARAVGWHVAMHRRAVQPGPGAAGSEELVSERGRRDEEQAGELERAAQAQGRQQPRWSEQRRKAREHGRSQRAEVAQVRRRERAPALAVARRERVEAGSRRVDVAKEDPGAALGERVRVARGRVHPAQAMALEGPSGEDRRGRRRRIDRGEDVVAEARQGELLGGYGAARAVGRLEDGDVAPRLGQRDRGREPVGPRADHDRRAAHPARRRLAIWCSMLSCSISP